MLDIVSLSLEYNHITGDKRLKSVEGKFSLSQLIEILPAFICFAGCSFLFGHYRKTATVSFLVCRASLQIFYWYLITSFPRMSAHAPISALPLSHSVRVSGKSPSRINTHISSLTFSDRKDMRKTCFYCNFFKPQPKRNQCKRMISAPLD